MTTCLLRCLQHPQPVQVVSTSSLVAISRATLHSFHSDRSTLFSRLPSPDTLQLPHVCPQLLRGRPRESSWSSVPKLSGRGGGEGWAVARVLRGGAGEMKGWCEAGVEEDVHEPWRTWPTAGGMSTGGGPFTHTLLGPRVRGAVLCIPSGSGFWPDSRPVKVVWLAPRWFESTPHSRLQARIFPALSLGLPGLPVDLTMTFTTLASQSPCFFHQRLILRR